MSYIYKHDPSATLREIAARKEPLRSDDEVTEAMEFLAKGVHPNRKWLHDLLPKKHGIRNIINMWWADLHCMDGGSDIHDGTYTVVFPSEAFPYGGTRLTLRFRTAPRDAKFAPARQVVSYLYGPDNQKDYRRFAFYDGVLEPWRNAKIPSLAEEAILVIRKDANACSTAYGLLSGRCGVCGRLLTDPVSIEAGIGPKCAEKRAW